MPESCRGGERFVFVCRLGRGIWFRILPESIAACIAAVAQAVGFLDLKSASLGDFISELLDCSTSGEHIGDNAQECQSAQADEP